MSSRGRILRQPYTLPATTQIASSEFPKNSAPTHKVRQSMQNVYSHPQVLLGNGAHEASTWGPELPWTSRKRLARQRRKS